MKKVKSKVVMELQINIHVHGCVKGKTHSSMKSVSKTRVIYNNTDTEHTTGFKQYSASMFQHKFLGYVYSFISN